LRVMPPILPIAFIEVRALSHATEDPEKVGIAIKNILPDEVRDEVQLNQERLEGHFGNPITLLKARVNKKSTIRKLVETLHLRLPQEERELLLSDLEQRIDKEGNLYLRLDKQAAYRGEMRLGSSDVIRLQFKLSLPRGRRQQIVEAGRQLISQ